MAVRPVFVPAPHSPGLVAERSVVFVWVAGMALSQKKKNVASLHAAAAAEGLEPLLEVSSKSDDELGRKLSAFSLELSLPDGRIVSLESAFQGSKVFRHGGPYTDLYDTSPRDAKRDDRLRSSGGIVGFRLLGIDVPSEPRTLFYDWLYMRALSDRVDLHAQLDAFRGFTDIEFNPKKSLNCQARSCALFTVIRGTGALTRAAESPEVLAQLMRAPRRHGTAPGTFF